MKNILQPLKSLSLSRLYDDLYRSFCYLFAFVFVYLAQLQLPLLTTIIEQQIRWHAEHLVD